MKPEVIWLGSRIQIDYAVERLNGFEPNGARKLVITDTRTKSERQRGLNWMWNREVSLSGVGGRHEDTTEGVHLVAKHRFALPILLASQDEDDRMFQALYKLVLDKHGDNPEFMMFFYDHHISTEKMKVHQMAEFLTDYERFYRGKGVNLTVPDRNLLNA